MRVVILPLQQLELCTGFEEMLRRVGSHKINRCLHTSSVGVRQLCQVHQQCPSSLSPRLILFKMSMGLIPKSVWLPRTKAGQNPAAFRVNRDFRYGLAKVL